MTQPISPTVRMAYVDVAAVRPAAHAVTPEGIAEFTHVPGPGVSLVANGQAFSNPSEHLPFIARHLLAVAALEGVDINAGWTS